MRSLLVAVVALAFVRAGSVHPSPCTLLSNREVAAAFSSKVVNRTSQTVGLGFSCVWSGMPLTHQYGQPSVRLTLFKEPEPLFIRAERQSGGQAIKGVGDAAIWIQKIDELNTWHNGYSLGVAVSGPYVTAPLAAAKTLTNAALTHM